jgi:hypothetical protein
MPRHDNTQKRVFMQTAYRRLRLHRQCYVISTNDVESLLSSHLTRSRKPILNTQSTMVRALSRFLALPHRTISCLSADPRGHSKFKATTSRHRR